MDEVSTMAYIATTTTDFAPRLRAQLGRFFAAMGRGFEAYADARSRRDQIERLERMSDAQLDKLGISRNQIVHYVFRDHMAL